jgi:hypothetical protein
VTEGMTAMAGYLYDGSPIVKVFVNGVGCGGSASGQGLGGGSQLQPFQRLHALEAGGPSLITLT